MIFGDAFLQSFYTVFDWTHRRIGFAHSVNQPKIKVFSPSPRSAKHASEESGESLVAESARSDPEDVQSKQSKREHAELYVLLAIPLSTWSMMFVLRLQQRKGALETDGYLRQSCLVFIAGVFATMLYCCYLEGAL